MLPTSAQTFAPAAEEPTTFLGAKLGLNIASDYDGRAWGDASPGPVLGGFASRNLGPDVALRIEVLFSRKGRADPPTRTDYIEIPLLLTWSAGGPMWRAIVPLGAAPSVLLGPLDSIGWRARRTDLGLVLGAGVERRTSSGRLQVEVRASSGLVDIAAGSLMDGAYLLNEVLSISAAYLHGL